MGNGKENQGIEVRYNLGWGNSVAVRRAFLDTYNGTPVVFSRKDLLDFDYPKHEGDDELVEITRKVIERQVGKSYRHVLLTNGATGGVVISLRAYFEQGRAWCLTRNPPHYVRYPEMINASGLGHVNETGFVPNEIYTVVLVDIPSNPLGLTTPIEWYPTMPTIFDGVYYNRVYMKPQHVLPGHNIMIGSYSKLLGLNGIRIGWIATNDDFLYERLKSLITSEYCGLCSAGSEIVKKTVTGLNWEEFEISARNMLDYNREEWSKLEKFFGDQSVEPVGMFYYAPIDQKCKALLEKSSILWTKGSDLGTIDDYGRFNIGQDPALIRSAVKAVLKNDRIKP